MGGQVDIKGQLIKRDVARFSRDVGGAIDGLKDWDETPLDGSPPSFTWATKPLPGANNYANTVVLITDLHSRGTTGGSLWRNTADGYIYEGCQPVNVTWAMVSSASWFGTAGGALNAAGWPGLRLHVTDYFVGGADIYSDGTRWRLCAGRAVLSNPPESALSVVAINQTDYVVAYAAWPVGLYRDGDRLAVHVTGKKSGTVDTVIARLGYSTSPSVFNTAAVLATTSILLTTITDNLSSVFSISRKSSTAMKVKGPNTFNSQGGTTANDLATDVTVTDLDTTQGYLLFACTTGANETFLPSTFLVELHTCGA